MKALTLYPPWALAVDRLGKDIENRIWPPPLSIIGKRIAIHAGAKMAPKRRNEEMLGLIGMAGRSTAPGELGSKIAELQRDLILGSAPASAIVATAVVIGFEQPTDRPTRPWHAAGQYGWLLTDKRSLSRPVPCKGALKLWDLPADVQAAVEAASLMSMDELPPDAPGSKSVNVDLVYAGGLVVRGYRCGWTGWQRWPADGGPPVELEDDETQPLGWRLQGW